MPTAVPTTADGLREELTSKTKLREIMSSPEGLINYVEAHVNARIKSDPSLTAQTSEQTEKFLLDFLRANPTIDDTTIRRLNLANPTSNQTRSRGKIYNAKALGARTDTRGTSYDTYFSNAADFFHSISNHAYRNDQLAERLHYLSNDLSSVKPSDGGFLIPEIIRAEMLRVSIERSVVRSRARTIPMESLTLAFPTIDSTSNVSSVFGGIVGYWTEEGATLTESQPRFSKVELRANKLCLYTEVPNELLRDARPALSVLLDEILPEALTWYEDVAFFVGGGVGEPLGFLNAPCTVAPTRSTTVAGQNVEWVDIVNMYARMLPQSLDRAVWVVSPEVLPSLLTMTVGSGNQAVWIGGGPRVDGSAAPPMSMLGAPLLVSEKARQVGTQGDINFVDFGYYLIGDRQAMSARQSEDFKFSSDSTAFRVIERLDGRPWLQDAITPQNGGDTLSPFVSLTTSV